MTPKQARTIAAANARLIGPRVPGGTYVSGYWGEAYTVEAIWCTVGDAWPWFRVRWSDGRTAVHCTPWDARADRAA
jgi:hypothetical protein